MCLCVCVWKYLQLSDRDPVFCSRPSCKKDLILFFDSGFYLLLYTAANHLIFKPNCIVCFKTQLSLATPDHSSRSLWENKQDDRFLSSTCKWIFSHLRENFAEIITWLTFNRVLYYWWLSTLLICPLIISNISRRGIGFIELSPTAFSKSCLSSP